MAKSYQRKTNDIYTAISEILKDYGDDVTEKLQAAVPVIAKSARDAVRKSSPIKSGRYKKGWRVNTSLDRYGVKSEVYNQDAYQLTHLLEHGYIHIKTGKRVGQKPHIKAVNDNAQKELERIVKEII